ncbi:hypothetical protein Asera_36880 [Actinocatenispora sera]|uniref:Uncharacterized protein n=1 Tax=Actinocatenispora sera TaxID=390989 RepID=A0A810L217_9ACTN|nr:hypothetical protein Asera_36880 [Actinocatenispora sera]
MWPGATHSPTPVNSTPTAIAATIRSVRLIPLTRRGNGEKLAGPDGNLSARRERRTKGCRQTTAPAPATERAPHEGARRPGDQAAGPGVAGAGTTETTAVGPAPARRNHHGHTATGTSETFGSPSSAV